MNQVQGQDRETIVQAMLVECTKGEKHYFFAPRQGAAAGAGKRPLRDWSTVRRMAMDDAYHEVMKRLDLLGYDVVKRPAE